MSDSGSTFCAGVYRGSVVDDADPDQRSRVQVDVPSVAVTGAWAEVSAPLDGDPVMPPSVGSSVWVMFEDGQSDYPVVIGTLVP